MKIILTLIAMPIRFLLRVFYRLPAKYKKVWYNRSCYIESEKYPKIFDENKNYIPCQKGLRVVMGQTKQGENIYYKVTRYWATRGGDWLSDSDAINCDLKFSHIE